MAVTPSQTPTSAASPGVDAAPAVDPVIQGLLEQGLALHSEGKMDDALVVYETILARDSENADALHLMGLLKFGLGQHDEGVALVRRAVAISPQFASALANLGTMLRQMDRNSEAIMLFRRSAEVLPNGAAGHRDLGYALARQGDMPGAADELSKAVQLDPEDVGAHVGLGLVRLSQNRLPEAEASLRHALGLRPAAHDVHLNLGVVLRRLGRLDEAMGSFRVAVLLKPDYMEALLNLGMLLAELARPEEAVGHLRKAAELAPQRGEVHMALGQVLRSQGDIDGAIGSFRRAVETIGDPTVVHGLLATLLQTARRPTDLLALEQAMVRRQPGVATNRVRLAQALMHLGRLDEATVSCERALALDPGSVDAVSTLAVIRIAQGRHMEAEQDLRSVLARQPQNAAARTNLATLELAAGDFEQGLADFEARFELPQLAAFRGAGTRLPALSDGPDLAGKHILLTAEQGLGDTIQFIRYAPLLAERGAIVTAEVQEPLIPLVEGIAGIAHVTPQGSIAPAFDFSCPMMSLARVFGTRVGTVPAAMPYLAAPAARREAWRARLGDAGGKRRVALCWSGNPDYAGDMFRSIPLQTLEPLLDDPALQVHLVQTDIRPGDDERVAARPGLVDLRRALVDLADAAAVLEAMDLVVTVDTSIAHLAAALGRPTWIMLPFAADWRWLRGRDDSPWYPTARLFRQREFGNWPSVADAVCAALREA